MDEPILEHAMTQVQDHTDAASAPGKRIACLLWVAMGVAGAGAMTAQAHLELSALAAPAPVALRGPAAVPTPAVRVSSGAGRPDKYGPAAYLSNTTKEMK